MAISEKLLNPGEKLVVSARQHPKALFGPILALVVLLAIGVAVQVVVGTDGDTATWTTRIVWILCGLGILWFTVRPFLDWLTTVHGVTDRRLITRRGIITRKGHDIPLARISDVSYEKGLVDRFLSCGTLVISDASEQGRVQLTDVPRVQKHQLQLSDLLFHGAPPTGSRRDDGT